VVSDAGVKTLRERRASEFRPSSRQCTAGSICEPRDTANSVPSSISTPTRSAHASITSGPWEVAIDENDGNLYEPWRLKLCRSWTQQRKRSSGRCPVGHYALHVMTGVDRLLVVNDDSVIVATEQDTLAGTQIATEWYHAGFDHYSTPPTRWKLGLSRMGVSVPTGFGR